MMIWPSAGSTSLNKAWTKVDLPLPVLSTTPIFSPLLILIVMPFKIRGVFCRYLTFRSLMSISPRLGQFGEGRQSATSHAASEGRVLY
uniref:Uncharacterized protein n=1 Tax=Arundo donax TaxID=35708 RepID=A0A0A9DLG5_ARUDO